MEGASPTKLILDDIEILRVHYYHTLRHWYDRTVAAKERSSRVKASVDDNRMPIIKHDSSEFNRPAGYLLT